MGKIERDRDPPSPSTRSRAAGAKGAAAQARAAPTVSAHLLSLQRSAGNAAVARLVTPSAAGGLPSGGATTGTVVVARSPDTKEDVRREDGSAALTTKDDYLIYGTWVQGDTHASFVQRVGGKWVAWRYGSSLSGAARAQIVERLWSDFQVFIQEPTPGQQYHITYDATFISGLSKLAGRDPDAQKADQREQEAGLPSAPPLGDSTATPQTAPPDATTTGTAPPVPTSDSEFTGSKKKTANAEAMRAELIGPEIAPTHSISSFRMRLDYASVVGSDHLAQLAEAMNFVHYHWEYFDVTALVVAGMDQQIRQQQAQKPVSDDDKVGRLDPAGRRAEQTAEQIVDETEAVVGELAHPVDAAHGGTAGDVITRAQGNIDSLVLTPASTIVSFGGVALGAIADVFGGDFHEQEIPWPRKQGYYMVRCIAAPKPREKLVRASSVAVKLVEVRPVAKLARAAVEQPHALAAEKELALALARDRKESPETIAKLERELRELRLTASGTATDVIALKIREKETELAAAPDWQKNGIEKQLDALRDQLEHAQKRAAGLEGTIWRPEGAIVSKLDGQTYPLLLQLGRVTGEDGEVWRLSDVSTRDGQSWVGRGATPTEAVRNAAALMSRGNSYGPGSLAIRFPAAGPFEATEHTYDNINTGTALARRRLADLAVVLAVLGLFIPGVGQIAALVGAAVAADRLIDRWQNGSLRLDADAVTDIIGVFGAAAQAVSTVGRMRVIKLADKFVLASSTADEAAILGAMRTAHNVSDLAQKANAIANWGGFAFGQTIALQSLLELTRAELSGAMSHAQARRRRAEILLGALRDHTLQFAPAPTAKPKAGPTAENPATTEKQPSAPDRPTPRGAAEGVLTGKNVRPMESSRRAGLEPALGDLAGTAEIVDNPDIGSSVLVRYKDGALRIEVGPEAGFRHVKAHAEVARILGQYQGPMGMVRRMLDRIGSLFRLTPGYGTKGFERRLEVVKLTAIEASLHTMLREMDARVERFGGDETIAAKERDTLQRELASIQAQLVEHQQLVDSYDPSRGFVAALDPATATHFADQAANLRVIDGALNAAGRPDLIVMLEKVAQHEAAGGNIEGFKDWVAETVSRVAGTNPAENKKQAIDKGVELAEIWRLSQQVRGDPNLVVRFTPGKSRAKTFDIRVEAKVPTAGESPVRREVEVAEYNGVPTSAGPLYKGIQHGASKVPPRSGGPGDLPRGRERESSVSIRWFTGTKDIPLPSKDGVRRMNEDGTSEILKGDPLRAVGSKEDLPQEILDNLIAGKVGKGVDLLHAVNIVTQEGTLLWRFVNTGTGRAPIWVRVQ
ncbi:hypothetical protein [uncultured Cellulomonas sp.]|uniref:hypothetical protein n=1 Tax=uncultured Cellulomonas sp. TaxID=189682 RepID=UPI0028E87A55|nr:hypothetical protein [uncultured Cellulomonas sp.]